jgi:hypothetical protein
MGIWPFSCLLSQTGPSADIGLGSIPLPPHLLASTPVFYVTLQLPLPCAILQDPLPLPIQAYLWGSLGWSPQGLGVKLES